MAETAPQRRLWKCPSCSRSYRIPAAVDEPKQCPQCRGAKKLAAAPTADHPLESKAPPVVFNQGDNAAAPAGAIAGSSQNPKERAKKIAGTIALWLFMIYLAGWMLATPYYNWKYAQRHGFWKWLVFGELVATAQAMAWPVDLVFGRSGKATKDRKAKIRSVNAYFDVLDAIHKLKDPPTDARTAYEGRARLDEALEKSRQIDPALLDEIYPGWGTRYREDVHATLLLGARSRKGELTGSEFAARSRPWLRRWDVWVREHEPKLWRALKKQKLVK